MSSDTGTKTESGTIAAPAWLNLAAVPIWLGAAVVAFLPFAFDTSPWNAVTFRVPGDQGNWWHLLVGLPFFLAFPMIWLRLRAVFASGRSSSLLRNLIWAAIGLSTAGTLLVETPFLLHLAGISDWQRVAVLSLGLGILALSALCLFHGRRSIEPATACFLGIDAAWLANTSLCLVVYSGATGAFRSRSGWFVAMAIVWAVALELSVLLIQAFRARALETAAGMGTQEHR